MDFTAIDFETANSDKHSACQLAVVRVRGGQIVDRQCWLIRPRPLYFSHFNVQVHGIQPAAVEQEPEFDQRWAAIAPYLIQERDDRCLIAHNAPFDIGVLTACLRHHRLPVPNLEFSCTRLIARRTWPDRPGYGLKPLASWLGIEFRHHDALEDSIACASLLLAAAQHVGATSIRDLEDKLSICRGVAGEFGYRSAKGVPARRRSPAAGKRSPAMGK